jgi:hypothetical protein
MVGRKSKIKKSKKSPTRKLAKASGGKATKKVARPKTRKTIKRKATALSRIHAEHGVFPDNPPIFAVDEADAEAAIGIKRGRR